MDLSWGGYRNGEIPTSKLVAVGKSPVLKVTQYLEAGAARCYLALDAAFYKEHGKHLTVTEGYRDLSRQKQLYYAYQNDPENNPLAAYYGTSNHGYARAADFGSNTLYADTPEAKWLVEHGPEYGFHPTGYKFARVEPWHYDWLPGTATASLNVTPIEQEEDIDMTDIKYYWKDERGTEYGIMGRDLPGGWWASTDEKDGEAMGLLFGTPEGAPWLKLPYDKWVNVQKLAKRLSAERVTELTAIAKAAGGTTTNVAGPTAAEIAAAVKKILPTQFTTVPS